MSKCNTEYQIGQILALTYRVHPFLSDDQVSIIEVSKQRGGETRYRVQSLNGQRAGWVYASDLAPILA